jgi:2'-hydroxyisoflavone reductase
VPWPERVRHLTGNRDPRIAPGLSALAGGEWDAAIDLSGYVPRCVNASCAELADSVGHCTFVSSVSVYADVSRPGVDETAPVAKLDDPSSEDIPAHYGALKARCEDEVRAAFGGRAFVVRPGLIVGPHDPTDRFAYWVARFVCP